MTAVRAHCAGTTRQGHRCRRTGSWMTDTSIEWFCKQHATLRATPHGGTSEISHVLTGERAEVTYVDRRKQPARPVGEQQIIREAHSVRTRAHLHDVRIAVINHLQGGGALTPDIAEALRITNERFRRTA